MRLSTSVVFLTAMALCPLTASAVTLSEVMQRAVEGDIRIPASLAISRSDDAMAAIERSSLLPSLSATASIAENDLTVSSDFFGTADEQYRDTSMSLTLRQAVFRWDMRSRWKRSRLMFELARVDEIDRRQNFLTRVLDRYSAILETQAELDFARAELEALSEEQDSIADRLRVGLSTVTAQRETEARMALAQANLLLAEDKAKSAEWALEELLAGPVPTLQPLPEKLARFAAPVEDEAGFVELARKTAYSVQRDALALAIAETQISSAIAEAAPKVDLVGTLSEDDTSELRIGQLRESSRIALELSVPLYAGGSAIKGLKAARANRDQADAVLELNRRVAAQEARDAWRGVETAYRRLDALIAASRAANIALDATRDGFDVGLRTQLDVLEARSAVLRAERDQILGRYAVLRALARRESAIGDLHSDDFPRFDLLFAASEAAQPQTSASE